MITRRTPTVLRSLVACVVLLALIATGCGTGATKSITEVAIDAPASTNPLSQPTGDTPQYGASLEEWAATTAHGSEPSLPTNAVPDGGSSEYSTIFWDDLIPPGYTGAELMAEFEERLEITDIGTERATALYTEIQAKMEADAVNTDINGQQIRLAGFVAPLAYDGDMITEFLLVPSFGACIHVPPPPPNQTIMVSLQKDNALTVQEAWGPVWVEGTIMVDPATTVLATASYRIDSAASGVYDNF